MGNIELLAHRGSDRDVNGHKVVEHSMDAYNAAIDFGADYVEADLYLTKDGILITYHDDEGFQHMTYAEAKEKYSMLAKFDDFIDLIKERSVETGRKINITLEIKKAKGNDEITHLAAKKAVDLLVEKEFTDTDRVYINSFDKGTLKYLHEEVLPNAGVDFKLIQLIPELTEAGNVISEILAYINPFVSYKNTSTLDFVDGYAYFIGINWIAGDIKRRIEESHDNGKVIHLYTFKSGASRKNIDKILKLGPDAVYADDSKVMREAIDGLQDKITKYGNYDDNNIEINEDSIKYYAMKGDDKIIVTSDNNIIYGDGGNDSITSTGSHNFLSGGGGDDVIRSLGSGKNIINGGQGNDIIKMQPSDILLVDNDADGTTQVFGGGVIDFIDISMDEAIFIVSEDKIIIHSTSGSNLVLNNYADENGNLLYNISFKDEGIYDYNGLKNKLSNQNFEHDDIKSIISYDNNEEYTDSEIVKITFKTIYDRDANDTEFNNYYTLYVELTKSGAADPRGIIADIIANDLRSSSSSDNSRVSEKHNLEFKIGTALSYDTIAEISKASSEGNPISTVNSGVEHTLENAEIAVLKDVIININSNNSVNLEYADYLKELTINGSKFATVNLSKNGVNPGVNITANNGNVVLNASSGDDEVTIGKEANIAHGSAKFNLGNGNDTLYWDGNATLETNNRHQVSEFITADGGSGVNTISANLITKKMHILDRPGYNYTDFTSNAANFKNFQYVELGGYTGKSESTSTSGGKLYTLATKSNVFDYGLLNGTAKGEGYLDESGVNRAPDGKYGYKKNTTQAEIPDNVGTLGMKLSSKADHVVVNNYFPSQATIAGNATASSDITLNLSDSFVGDTFNIHFDYSENADSKNAGVLELNVPDDVKKKVNLKTINIDSNGNGNTEDTLFLAGTNYATSINISGNNHVNLKVNSEYKELRSIDASNNNASVTISSDVSGQGNGKWSKVVKQIPKDKWTGEFVSQDVLTVKGSSFDDTLTLKDAMVAYGNAGNDTFIIGASSTMLETGKTVTIADFDVKEDKIVDMDSGISFSSEYSTGNAIYDYGVRSPEEIAAIKKIASSGSFTPDKTGFDLVSKMLSLSRNDHLDDRVGLATVGETHYLIIDQNNDHRLDELDKIIVIKGGSHDEIINTLKYSEPELNGVPSNELQYTEMLA